MLDSDEVMLREVEMMGMVTSEEAARSTRSSQDKRIRSQENGGRKERERTACQG